jgi:pimeloyl-ACP methyl ester carboxylesterase
MAETYRVIVPDLRGWGWSDAPPGDYAKSTLAADIVELLDAEGLDAVRIVAHDWGGYAAFLVALGQPARVERMVVLDIAPPWRGAFHPRQLALPLVGAYQGLLATFGLGPWTLTSSGSLRARGDPGGQRPRHALGRRRARRLRRRPARAGPGAGQRRLLSDLPDARAAGRHGRRRPLRRAARADAAGDGRGRARCGTRSPRGRGRRCAWTIRGAGHFLPEEAPERVLELAMPFLG